MNLVSGGFYILSDQYYIDFPDPYLKQNKQQHRPFYYCLCDAATGLYWMIPLSSSADKLKLANEKISQGKTDLFHLTNLSGKPGVMLLCDMCPVTKEYISSEYTINGVPVIYKNTKETKIIRSKASKILALLRKGVKFTGTQPDVFLIEAQLLKNSKP